MLSDVIAAIATPPGRSAIAVIRLSGDAAHEVASEVLDPFDRLPYRQARRSRLHRPSNGEVLDEVLYVTYGGPASYTGQHVVEIFTHGGVLAPVEALAALMSAGARQASPGEFTRRAVMNGKLDLLQAEAVGDLIDATAPAQRRAAINQLDRSLSKRIELLREGCLELEALTCYDIDFPEEDSGPVPSGRVEAALTRTRALFVSLIGTAADGERLREGAIAVVAGRPNVGKSSLFNSLLGADRAIVTEIAGTTRDAIEAPMTCEGYPFRLVDTAGLRTSEDALERLGIEVSWKYLRGADAVLFCAESGRELEASARAFIDLVTAPLLLVRTKADLASSAEDEVGIQVSTKTGLGIYTLRGELARLGFAHIATSTDGEPHLTRARHRHALQRGLEELDAFGAARAAGLEGAVAAVHLRTAVSALEDVIGLVSREDVLDRVFATFCIGK
jgi:tRNA modification GTPase